MITVIHQYYKELLILRKGRNTYNYFSVRVIILLSFFCVLFSYEPFFNDATLVHLNVCLHVFTLDYMVSRNRSLELSDCFSVLCFLLA